MKLDLKGKSFSARAGLAGAVAAAVAFAGFCIYGALYNEYFDLIVAGCLLLGALCAGAYAMLENKFVELLNLAAVFFLCFAVGLFGLNSYEVWADWYGNFDMYGSRGGVVPVIVLIALFLIAILCDIVSCFTVKRAGINVQSLPDTV